MHSNFITPPDFVNSILVVDATEPQIQAIADCVRSQNKSYNIYFYHTKMDNLTWLAQAIDRVDNVLLSQDSTAPILNYVHFGPDQVLKEPADYFNK